MNVRRLSAWFGLGVLAGLTCLTGCVPDEDLSKTATQFDQASTELTGAFSLLVVNANTIQANHYIDQKAFTGDPINAPGIKGSGLLTEDEIKLRVSAIHALADYTSALATLAGGKDAAKIQTDCDAAKASFKTLANDAAAALQKPTSGSKTPDYGTPVAAAVSAMGDVINLILRHHGAAEVRESIVRNDPQVSALYRMISSESEDLYAKQKNSVGLTGVTLFADYNRARLVTPLRPADMLQIADRLKQWEKDKTALDGCDPKKAVEGFKSAHDALIDTVTADGKEKKKTLAELIAAVKSFAADVTPLAQNLNTLANSLT